MFEVYINNDKNEFCAKGTYNINSNELTVLKKSIVSEDVPFISTFNSNSIIENRNKYVKDSIVMQDVLFKSPSSAASFITGRSANGLTLWKTKEGKSLKEIINDKEKSNG